METARQDEKRWRIELFGGLRAHSGTRTVERFPTQKTAELLTILALSPGRRHTRERLVDALWPEAAPAAGRDRLSQALVWLRPQLEPAGTSRGSVLPADRTSVGLSAASVTTDVAEFEAALATADQAETDDASRAALEEAVALYHGDLQPGVYSDWVLPERRRLQNASLRALSRLSRFYEEAGDSARALDTTQRALEIDPLYEEACRGLIRLLAATGRTSDALRRFQELKGLLARELDSEPSAETLALAEQIRHAAPTPKPVPSTPPVSALPTPLTRFFGREDEIARVRRMILVDGARLVTLLGTGGAGKTRLCLAVAADLRDIYDRAVAFVPLADLHDAQMLPAAIAEALRLPATAPGPSLEQVTEALRGHPFLLILDNLEHLLTGAAPLVRTLLEQTPSLIVLVTSRQRLGVAGEWELPVPSLPLPGPAATPEQIGASPSVRLFLDRARAVRPDFILTPANRDSVAQVCARLEGIPLAIELCAAWAQTLTPSQMLSQLGRRFGLLVSRRADITPRHRTLRAAIEYSYLQLPPDLQHLFTRLAVFRGGWTLDAAQTVCAENPESDALTLVADLTELRERSLIAAEESDGAEMRYRVLDTLREFAVEQLTYADRTKRRRAHLAYFLTLAETGATGPEQERWLARLAREQENLRAALAWSMEEGDIAPGLRLATALNQYWTARGPLSEGHDWLRRLLDRAEEIPTLPIPVRADAWSALGQIAWSQGDYIAAQEAHEEALALRRETGDRVAESLYHLGITAYRRDDYTTARGYLEESLSLARAADDQAGIARVLLNLGNIAYERQDHAQAEEFFRQSLALEQALGNRPRVSGALNNLALTAIAARDYPKADSLLNDALAIRREMTDHYGSTTVLVGLGAIARLQGQPSRARDLLCEGLTLAQEVGDRHVTAIFLMEFGLLASAEGDPARAVPLLAASERLFQKLGGSPGSASAGEFRQALDAARAALDPATFDSLLFQGRTTPSDQIVSRLLETGFI